MRNALALTLLASCSMLAIVSCKKSAEMAASEPASGDVQLRAAGAPATAGEEKEQAGSAPHLADAGRKLVKTVDLELRVSDTTAVADRLKAIATATGGYVSAMSADRRNELLYYTLTLRVPVDRLEETLAKVKSFAERVERESIRTEDVTERWVDIEARLVALRATEKELLQLLTEARQRNQKVEDIMAVYGKLTEIRTAIEQLQGEQQALQGLTSLSTINVQLTPTEAATPIVAEGWSPGGTARQSFRTLVGALQSLADIAIVVLIVALPIALLVLLPIWLLRRLWRRARAPRAQGD
jgi:hypothetical protein